MTLLKSKHKFKEKLVVSAGLIILLFLGTMTTIAMENNIMNSTQGKPNSDNNEIIISGTDDTVFGQPILTPTDPASNESLQVDFRISDPDGIKNASLFWQYDTINSTLFNSTMSESTDLIIDVTNDANIWNTSGYITDGGDPTSSTTSWRYGNFTLDKGSKGINSINSILEGQHADDFLVYYLIQKKNLTTGEWTTVVEDGSIGGTTDLGSPSFSSSQRVSAYNIFAITYDSDPNPPPFREPQFVDLEIGQTSFTATIPAPNQPSKVSYNVTVFDNLNNSDTSSTHTSLFDWGPDVQLNNLPSVLPKNQNLLINATVTDLDGNTTIKNETVTAYYKLISDSDWSSITLNYSKSVNENSSIYTNQIQTPDVGEIEEQMIIQVNATDLIGTELGRTGSSGNNSLIVDNASPRPTSIDIEGDSQGLENITLGTSEVNVTLQLEDASGIKNVSIFYEISSGEGYSKLEMINTTITSENADTATFTVLVPAANQTTTVEYFFETIDYFGNVGNTSLNNYFADNSAPSVTSLRIFPDVVSNVTSNANILFNATDDISLRQTLLWYSMDNQTTWTNTLAQSIVYSDWRDYLETFTMENLPFLIPDNDVSNLTLHVERGGKISNASLQIELNHELTTDLRIWLVLEDGREFVIFNRESRAQNTVISVNLIDLGLSQSDFNNNDFTLRIRDFSDLYSGSITNYNITLEHFTLPLGYQFVATVPKSQNDTDVYFYLDLTDFLFNSQNTMVYNYYSDGLPPSINITNSNTVDLNGSRFVTITANIQDKNELTSVELFYKFSQNSFWIIRDMILNTQTNQYYFDIPIETLNGTIYYYILAADQAGHSQGSQNQILNFERAFSPFINITNTPTSPVDINSTGTFRVFANVTAFRNLESVSIQYRFQNGSSWQTGQMQLNQETGQYYFDIPLPSNQGMVQFRVQATDEAQLVSQSDIITINYNNANPPGTTQQGLSGLQIGLIIVGILVFVGGIGGGLYYLRKQGKI